MPRHVTIAEVTTKIRDNYDEEIDGLIAENKGLRELIAGMMKLKPKEQQPKVLQGWITSKAINIDKLGVLLRARRDLDAETSDNVQEDWTQVVLDKQWAS